MTSREKWEILKKVDNEIATEIKMTILFELAKKLDQMIDETIEAPEDEE